MNCSPITSEELEPRLLRALVWIVEILKRHQVPFQVTGGLAVSLYGGHRPIADIDLDIPEDRFQDILDDVRPYITFGPALHTDDNWKVFLLTLNYEGQDIDLGGAYETLIFDSFQGQWVPSPANFDRVHMVTVSGLEIPVVDAGDLITYKEKLGRPVDLVDISFVWEHVLRSRSV